MAQESKNPRSPLIEAMCAQKALHFGTRDLGLRLPSATVPAEGKQLNL